MAVIGLQRIDPVLDEAIKRANIRDSRLHEDEDQNGKSQPINSSNFKMEKVNQISKIKVRGQVGSQKAQLST